MHYAKGQTAKKHKYIRKEGNRYIYPDDDKGKSRTDQENIDAARDWRRNAPSSNRSMLTAREAQKQGFKRTENERAKIWDENGFKPINGEYNKEVARVAAKDFARRDLQVKKAAKAAQKAGERRTDQENYKQYKKVFNAFDSAAREQEKGRNKTAAIRPKLLKGPTGFSKTAAKLREQSKIAAGGKSIKVGHTKFFSSAEYNESETKKSMDYMKKAKKADSIYRKGEAAANNDQRKYGRNNPTNKPPKNKTARKNQRKAKIEYANYKVRSIKRKALKKGKKNLNALLNKIKRR